MGQKETESSRSRWRALALLLALLLALALGYLWLRPGGEVAALAPAPASTPDASEQAFTQDGGSAVRDESGWGEFVQSWTQRDSGRAAGGKAAQVESLDAGAREAADGGTETLTYVVAEVPNTGTISGRVLWARRPSTLPPLAHQKDQKVCGASGPDDSLLVGHGGGLANVVVSLGRVNQGKPHQSTATLDQLGCAYVPRVQAVTVGTTLTVMNSDPILHNVHAFLGAQTVFNLAMPIKHQRIPVQLSKVGLVKLKCDVHNWMTGAIDVLQNPYFAVTAADGRFTITGIPPGAYVLNVWHEVGGSMSRLVSVVPQETVQVNPVFGSPRPP